MTVDLLAHLVAHIALAGSALALALLIGVPLGAIAADRPAIRAVSAALAGALRVIPSLAILTLAIPLLGLGFGSALAALVVLALPPIFVNTEVGLRGVPAATLQAARGTGMTLPQVAARVRWPLALPVVMIGVRTAAVEVIASATLAAFIGAGGLGDYIVNGTQTGNLGEVTLGAVAVATLALAADIGLGALARRAGPLSS